MLQRMLQLRSASESSAAATAAAATAANVSWPFPEVEPYVGPSSYVDTVDICPGEDGLLEASTGSKP